MSIDDHGSCVHCGFDLNGERIWDYFFKREGSEEEATRSAAMYGATKDFGRFGKEIYVKSYSLNWDKLPSFYACPSCGEKCYDKDSNT